MRYAGGTWKRGNVRRGNVALMILLDRAALVCLTRSASLPRHPHIKTVVRAMSQVFAWRAHQEERAGKRKREGGGGT